ncbi:MAG: hypothetical protein KAS39_06600 [Actinomycetia bacterium]|nr:hypothetical protein [Actinomycetes bacterium]
MEINCEGYLIAYSILAPECSDCKVNIECAKETKRKLLNAKGGPEPMEKPLTKKQLEKILGAADKKKEVALINKKNGYGCSLVKGMTIEEAKELIMAAAFPPEEDDFDDFDDPETAEEEDDFEDADTADEVAGDPQGSGPEETAGADEDLDDLDDLDDNPDADPEETAEAKTDKPAAAAGTPDDLDEEEYDNLLNRLTSLEKRMDDLYDMMAKKKDATPAAKKAENAATLLAGVPYKEAALKKLNGKEIKQLCKELGDINSFQKKIADLIPMILEHPKNVAA